jgi:hypothetical protein
MALSTFKLGEQFNVLWWDQGIDYLVILFKKIKNAFDIHELDYNTHRHL